MSPPVVGEWGKLLELKSIHFEHPRPSPVGNFLTPCLHPSLPCDHFLVGFEQVEMSKMTSVPGFLTKTYEIFSTPEYYDICSWGVNGDTIIIKKVGSFAKHLS